MKENVFWDSIKKALPYVHWQRIESSTGQGIPDVNGCIGGDSFWLELKVVSGIKVHLRSSQVAWLMRRSDVGGSAWILIKKKDIIYLYHAYQAKELMKQGLKLSAHATFKKPHDFEELLRIIRK